MTNKKWYIEKANTISNAQVIKDSTGKILITVWEGEQAEENAKLCAAAPELLELCKMFYEAATDNVIDVRSAIYKYEELLKQLQ